MKWKIYLLPEKDKAIIFNPESVRFFRVPIQAGKILKLRRSRGK